MDLTTLKDLVWSFSNSNISLALFGMALVVLYAKDRHIRQDHVHARILARRYAGRERTLLVLSVYLLIALLIPIVATGIAWLCDIDPEISGSDYTALFLALPAVTVLDYAFSDAWDRYAGWKKRAVLTLGCLAILFVQAFYRFDITTISNTYANDAEYREIASYFALDYDEPILMPEDLGVELVDYMPDLHLLATPLSECDILYVEDDGTVHYDVTQEEADMQAKVRSCVLIDAYYWTAKEQGCTYFIMSADLYDPAWAAGAGCVLVAKTEHYAICLVP